MKLSKVIISYAVIIKAGEEWKNAWVRVPA